MSFHSKKFIQNSTTLLSILVLSLVVVFVFLPLVVSAQASLGIESASSLGLGTRDLKEIIGNVLRVLLGFLGLVAVIIILYGGYQYLTSEGDAGKIEEAKKTIINAAIGLVIVLASYAIVTYFFKVFNKATFDGELNNNGGPITFNGTALGAGVLNDVYPYPGAQNVPRNTMIMASFKVPMKVESIIDTSKTSGCPVAGSLPTGVVCGNLKEYTVLGKALPAIKILNKASVKALTGDQVVVLADAEKRNFILDPIVNLGSDTESQDYSINLSDNIKQNSGQPAFLIGGYTWQFQVGNFLDLTPPRIESVVPGHSIDPNNKTMLNAIVQINFNEAVNPLASTGQVKTQTNGALIENGWDNLILRYSATSSPTVIPGTWQISNQFKTVEFIPDKICEMPSGQTTNSCGEVPKCLPASTEIIGLVKAAQIVNGQVSDIFSGVTDAAANSLDGGAYHGIKRDNKAEGRPADDQDQYQDVIENDNYFWNFRTGTTLDLTPPKIIENPAGVNPDFGAINVPKNFVAQAFFNEPLRSSTINSDTVRIFEYSCLGANPAQAQDFPTNQACYPQGGFSLSKTDLNNYPTVNQLATVINIIPWSPYLKPLTKYNPRLNNKIQDLYQNCYYPSAGPCSSSGGSANPYCGF